MTTLTLFRAPTGLKWTSPVGETAHLVSHDAPDRSEAKTACGELRGVHFSGKTPTFKVTGVCYRCLDSVAER